MFTAVAVLPQPPLLVPGLATGAAAETAALRDACRSAASRLAAAAPTWIAVGADPGGRRTVGPEAVGTFLGFGVDLPVALDTTPGAPAAPPDPELPLPLLIAGWAAGQTGAALRIRGELVSPDTAPADCAELGAKLAAEAAAADGPVGLLVLGDGSAMHTEKAPGHFDERAGRFDAAVAAALAAADAAALATLDSDLAAQLWAEGRAPWQVLAGAASAAAATSATTWSGELLHSSTPYGVAYHVAVWTPGR
ncbi:hypothetical protein ACVGVM_09440 [Pseudonocardia bannensis]|uniref:hypothetical protein n=1 Tax=Pseudonocardia bannensis TaxID=630973 RepID=UPI0028AFBB3B|nr:hypothetical protein [Pseudonocardia bannensis]